MASQPWYDQIAGRVSALQKSLKNGRLSSKDGEYLREHYCFIYKDGTKPALGLGRSGAYQNDASDDKGSATFVTTTYEEDRDGDIVYPGGYRGKNYARNPVWFFGHQEWLVPIGTSRAPDGTISVFPSEQVLKQVCYFDREDPDADFIYGKVRRKILSATSIAFVPIEAYKRDKFSEKGMFGKANPHTDPSDDSGWFFKVWDHTETSIVGVPSNAGAIRDTLDKEKTYMSPRLQKAWQPYCAKSKKEQGLCWTGYEWTPCPTKKSLKACATMDTRNTRNTEKKSCGCKDCSDGGACPCDNKKSKVTKGNCAQGETSANTGCTPADGGGGKKPGGNGSNSSAGTKPNPQAQVGTNPNTPKPKPKPTAPTNTPQAGKPVPGWLQNTREIAGYPIKFSGKPDGYYFNLKNEDYGPYETPNIAHSAANNEVSWEMSERDALSDIGYRDTDPNLSQYYRQQDRLRYQNSPDHTKSIFIIQKKEFSQADSEPARNQAGEIDRTQSKPKDRPDSVRGSQQQGSVSHRGEPCTRGKTKVNTGCVPDDEAKPDTEKHMKKSAGLSSTSGQSGGYTVATDTRGKVQSNNGKGSRLSDTETEGWESCTECHGSGNCKNCKGSGELFQDDDGVVTCKKCGGSGNCKSCKGVGNIEKGNPMATRKGLKTKAAPVPPPDKDDEQEQVEDVTDVTSTPTPDTDTGTDVDMDMDVDVDNPPGDMSGDMDGGMDGGMGAGGAMGGVDPAMQKASVDEPFSPKPSARAAAQLYQHYQNANTWLEDTLKGMDHPGMSEGFDSHRAGPLAGAMEDVKALLNTHHGAGMSGGGGAGVEDPSMGGGDDILTKVLKALEAESGGGGMDMNPGEEGMVANGDVAPSDMDTPSTDDSGTGAAGGSQVPPEPANDEILQRYQTPKGWITRCVGHIRVSKNGSRYFVAKQGYSIMKANGNEYVQGSGKSSDLKEGETAAPFNKGMFGNSVGELGKAVTPDDIDNIQGAGSMMSDMADDESVPKSYRAPAKHYAKQLGKVYKALSCAGKYQADQGPNTGGSKLDSKGKEQRDGGGGGTLTEQGSEQASSPSHGSGKGTGEYVTGSGKVDWGKKGWEGWDRASWEAVAKEFKGLNEERKGLSTVLNQSGATGEVRK